MGPGRYRYKPCGNRQLIVRLAIIYVLSSVLLIAAARAKLLPLELVMVLGSVTTWGCIIGGFMMRSTEDSLVIDLESATLSVGEKTINASSSYQLQDIALRTDSQGDNPAVIDFVSSSAKGEIYRIRLNRRERQSYGMLVAFFKQLLERSGGGGSSGPTSVGTSSKELLLSIVITLGLVFGFMFFMTAVPALGAYLTNTGVFGAVAFFFLIIAAVVGANALMGYQSMHWPSVSGEIVLKEIVKFSSGKSSTAYPRYHPRVRYRYAVDGRMLIGRSISFCSEKENSLEGAEKEAAQWEPGKAVQVFYHPRKPSNSVLRTGIDRGSIFFLLFLCGVAAVLAFFALRNWEGIHPERYSEHWNDYIDNNYPLQVDFSEGFTNASTPFERQLAFRFQALADTLERERDSISQYYSIDMSESKSVWVIEVTLMRNGEVGNIEPLSGAISAEPVSSALYKAMHRQSFADLGIWRRMKVRCSYVFE
jgi:hypothetical protein